MASIIKRKKNYSIVYNYTDENGETRQKWETRTSYQDALKRKAEVENQQFTGTFLPPSNQTIAEFLLDFVSLYGEKKWGVSMYDSQNSLIANYINPIIGDMKVQDVTPRVVDMPPPCGYGRGTTKRAPRKRASLTTHARRARVYEERNQRCFGEYVTIPKDLSRIQSKVLFGLTKRQMICFGTAALVGVPLFFLAKASLGTTTAALCMILVMLPFFLFAMYEKNGQPLEVFLGHLIQNKFIRPKVRIYQTNNLYSALVRQSQLEQEVKRIARKGRKTGKAYDIVAGTFLVVGLGSESFASLPPDMIQKYTEQFKRPELFASINGQIVSVPVEPENPLHTAEMTLEDDYGMIDGVINNGRRGEELEKAQAETRRTTPEKKPSIREQLEDAKRECGTRKAPDKPAPQKKPPEVGDL